MDNPSTPMPRYKCHKVVSALKIAKVDWIQGGRVCQITPTDVGFARFFVNEDWVRRFIGHTLEGGYYVVYGDGYASFSPAKAFEDGYTRIDVPDPAADVPRFGAHGQLQIGRVVHYCLSEADAEAINRRRTDGKSIAERMERVIRGYKSGPLGAEPENFEIAGWPEGAQAHIGNRAVAGQLYPAVVVLSPTAGALSPPPGTVNLQVFLDGNDVFWARAVPEGHGHSEWRWPEREK